VPELAAEKFEALFSRPAGPKRHDPEAADRWARLRSALADCIAQFELRGDLDLFEEKKLPPGKGSWTARTRPGPAHDWADSANLLSVVAELDAAVVASEAGDGARAIGHIRAAREGILEDAKPIRVSVAAQLLGLSRKTVDVWADAGLLTVAEEPGSTVKVLDPRRLYEVKTLVDDLRAAGKKRGLAEAVWHRLQDRKAVESTELQESLEQMRRGETVSLDDYLASVEVEDE
jgi:hypothetical protein